MEIYFASKTDKAKIEIKITKINKSAEIAYNMHTYPNILKSN